MVADWFDNPANQTVLRRRLDELRSAASERSDIAASPKLAGGGTAQREARRARLVAAVSRTLGRDTVLMDVFGGTVRLPIAPLLAPLSAARLAGLLARMRAAARAAALDVFHAEADGEAGELGFVGAEGLGDGRGEVDQAALDDVVGDAGDRGGDIGRDAAAERGGVGIDPAEPERQRDGDPLERRDDEGGDLGIEAGPSIFGSSQGAPPAARGPP